MVEKNAALEALDNLLNICAIHRRNRLDEQARLNVREAEAPFQYGQNFEIDPEVWDNETGEGYDAEAYLRELQILHGKSV